MHKLFTGIAILAIGLMTIAYSEYDFNARKAMNSDNGIQEVNIRRTKWQPILGSILAVVGVVFIVQGRNTKRKV